MTASHGEEGTVDLDAGRCDEGDSEITSGERTGLREGGLGIRDLAAVLSTISSIIIIGSSGFAIVFWGTIMAEGCGWGISTRSLSNFYMVHTMPVLTTVLT